MNWWVRLNAWLRGARLVWLLHFDDDVTLSYAVQIEHPWKGTRWVAYRYPFNKVGQVFLEEDGTCSGPASYIENWKWADREARP